VIRLKCPSLPLPTTRDDGRSGERFSVMQEKRTDLVRVRCFQPIGEQNEEKEVALCDCRRVVRSEASGPQNSLKRQTSEAEIPFALTGSVG